MSALRLGRLPDGTRHVLVIDDGAVGRVSHTRGSISGGSVIVTETARDAERRVERERAAKYSRQVSPNALDPVMKNPDNGAVEASITEVHR